MHPFPHSYHAQAEGLASGTVRISTDAAASIETTAPPEFDGPPGYWSPESLLVASVADCYILSFRAVARASKLEWSTLSVDVTGVLDRVEGVTRFVRFDVKPHLTIPAADREPLARSVMDKAKRSCLVTNSLTAHCELMPTLTIVAPAAA